MALIENLNASLLDFFAVLAAIYLLFGLDDLIVDLLALVYRVGPKRLHSSQMRRMHSLPEKNIAIIVPAWKEGNIIDRMLLGNLERIDYARYHIFVGCYPNDPGTIEKVKSVSATHPQVHAIINYKDGPTSKGQCLNHVLRQILEFEKHTGVHFHAFLMQDSEDLIHPKTLKVVNQEINSHDFVQIPVFSLEVSVRELVAGTYVDEFAESHTKDILVRKQVGAAVPSAGVGTALSRKLVMACLGKGDRRVFNESSLTEDYELGVRAHSMGLSPTVACYYYLDPQSGKPEFIAT